MPATIIFSHYRAPGRRGNWQGNYLLAFAMTERRLLGWPHERVLWGSTIVLYEKFFSEVVTHPVPVDLAVLRQLRRSPLALDVYSWLTWRMSFLRKQTPIPWEHLEDQFGANYARPLDFPRGSGRPSPRSCATTRQRSNRRLPASFSSPAPRASLVLARLSPLSPRRDGLWKVAMKRSHVR